MPKKDALNVYVADWLVATEMLPVISYRAAEQFFHTVCELLNFKHITIRENKHRKGAICCHNVMRNTHKIEIGRCTKLTEILVLHEIAHTYHPNCGHSQKFVMIYEGLIRAFLSNSVLEKWNYYNSQVQKLRTKDQITKFYWDRIGEIQKVS
jgi:hypothetical protein